MWVLGIALALVLLLDLGLLAVPGFADQIYVCTGCTAPPGGDPNLIDPASINVGFAGSHTSVSPLLILVGAPNAGSAPTISLPSGVNPAAAGTYYGLNFATSGGLTGVFEGSLTSAAGTNAYGQSGLNTGAGGGASESWANWDAFNSAHGINDGTSFSLYAYAINFALDSTSGGNSPITIDFSGIATGSFVIAYNCAVTGSACTGGDLGETPFTNAGNAVSTPVSTSEASSTLLLSLALLGVAVVSRKLVQVKG